MWHMVLLCVLSGLQTDSNDEKLHVQVTVPEKIRSIASKGYETNVSYKVTIDGKAYTVNLVQKMFLPQSFRVYSYDDSGIMKPLDQPVENLCYYQGYIEDYPNSMVIVSTCTGLRGLLQFGNVSYGIEPLESSVGFEHVVYQVKNSKIDASLYAEKDIELRDLPYKIQSVKLQRHVSHYIEMHIIVEKQLYDYMRSNTAIVTQKVFQLVGMVNAIFTSFNLTVVLSSLEFWIDENKISTMGDANELLHRFLKWKRSYLVLRPHDVAFLLIYRETSNYVGATFQGMLCDKNYAGGIALYPKAINLESFAIIIVQLLSLSMGIGYDDMEKCGCPGELCIMNPEVIHSSGIKSFSNCSMEEFENFLSSHKSQCLQNQPQLQPSYKQAGTCGDGVVDAEEICDCGQNQDCTAKPPECCDPKTCRLAQGAVCGKGTCCEKCNFKKKGDVCRPAADECDLTEYCNGSSGECQENFFIHDGHPCDRNRWICLNGMCMSGAKQCEDMFGRHTDFGANECYRELNSKTDISGNCGVTKDGYQPCSQNDLKCGKLICKYEGERILKIEAATIIYANVEGHLCIAVEFPLDHENSKKMWVNDGTVCDSKKVCKNKACVADTFLNYDCTPESCNNHGVCNNKKHCHCNPSYLPPNCEGSDDTWPGGSVDSGNQRAESIPERPYIETAYRSKPIQWPFFLIVPFYIVVCVLTALLVKVRFQRKNWKTEDYSSEEQFETESELKD